MVRLQGDSSEEEGLGGGSEEEGSEEEEEEEDAAAHAAMLEAVTGGGAAARRRRKAKEVVVTEAYPESAYNLPASGEADSLPPAPGARALGSKGMPARRRVPARPALPSCWERRVPRPPGASCASRRIARPPPRLHTRSTFPALKGRGARCAAGRLWGRADELRRAALQCIQAAAEPFPEAAVYSHCNITWPN